MGCKEDESTHKPKPGRFRCDRCGAVAKKGKELCKPKKIKRGSSDREPRKS